LRIVVLRDCKSKPSDRHAIFIFATLRYGAGTNPTDPAFRVSEFARKSTQNHRRFARFIRDIFEYARPWITPPWINPSYYRAATEAIVWRSCFRLEVAWMTVSFESHVNRVNEVAKPANERRLTLRVGKISDNNDRPVL
jgi:hypothetical protein